MNADEARKKTTEKAREATDKAREATEKTIEEVKVAGNQLVDKVRDLIEEGNVRRIKVVREGKTLLEIPLTMREGKTLLEIPLTIAAGAGAAVVLLNPVIAALGALAALLTDVTLVVERDEAAAKEQQAIASENTGAGPQNVAASKPVTDHPGADAATGKTIGKD